MCLQVQGHPWEVFKELNGIRHVGCQFYSVCSTENESRVTTPVRLQIRLMGWSMGVSSSRGTVLGVSEEPNDTRHTCVSIPLMGHPWEIDLKS